MLKVAVIGCGYWGKNLVRNFSDLSSLSAICDSNISNALALSIKYKIPVKTFEEILLDPEIQGVIIAVPAAQHAILGEKALNAGKHVYIEKPLALKVKDAEYLCKLAHEKKRILMVGHLLQYHPAYIALKEIVLEGQLGKLQYIYSSRLNLGKIRSEENILWSFAPHDISMILGLVGSLPETVHAVGSHYLTPRVADITNTHLIFRDNIVGHIFVSWLYPYKEQKLVVVGEKGMAVFDDSKSWMEKLIFYPHQINWIDGVPCPNKAEGQAITLVEAEPLKLECQHFLDCMKTGIEAKTNGQEGLDVLRVLDAAESSLTKGLIISMNCKSTNYFKHESSYVDEDCLIGDGTKIWHFSHILKGSKIGQNVIISQNVMIGPDVIVGNNCKIQNNVSLYKGVILDDGVFCGPSCVFTNVYNPRAEIERKNEFRLTYVEKGVTIGANATVVCGVKLGAYSFIGAGAVVKSDVPSHALMVGVPAKQIGWVSHAGERLGKDLICPREKRRYRLTNGCLEEIIERKVETKEMVREMFA